MRLRGHVNGRLGVTAVGTSELEEQLLNIQETPSSVEADSLRLITMNDEIDLTTSVRGVNT